MHAKHKQCKPNKSETIRNKRVMQASGINKKQNKTQMQTKRFKQQKTKEMQNKTWKPIRNKREMQHN